jgi:uncharacterized metal-binding protein
MSASQPSEQPPVVSAPGPFQDLSVEPPSHRRMNHHMPWFGGAILILVGVIFLIGEFTSYHLQNWWALFILIPAFSSFASAWAAYQKQQRFTSAVRGPLIGGIILTCVALIFLLQLDLGRYWPIFLIVAGVAVLLGALIRDKEPE